MFQTLSKSQQIKNLICEDTLLVLRLMYRHSIRRYCGKVDNATMLSIQKSADLLICPRKPDDYTTKYTFPSKVLEYICSGVPVLSNALLGIPEEYKEYISFADEPTPYAWALAMQTILKDGEKQKQRAQDAREKVLTTKSWVMQTLKVKTFIEQNL